MAEYKKYDKRKWHSLIAVLVVFLSMIMLFTYKGAKNELIIILALVLIFIFLSNKELSMSNDNVVIKYTFLPFLSYKFKINEIEKITINYAGGKASEEIIKFQLKYRKPKRFTLTLGAFYQEFIDDARKKGVQVDTSRHHRLK